MFFNGGGRREGGVAEGAPGPFSFLLSEYSDQRVSVFANRFTQEIFAYKL